MHQNSQRSFLPQAKAQEAVTETDLAMDPVMEMALMVRATGTVVVNVTAVVNVTVPPDKVKERGMARVMAAPTDKIKERGMARVMAPMARATALEQVAGRETGSK